LTHDQRFRPDITGRGLTLRPVENPQSRDPLGQPACIIFIILLPDAQKHNQARANLPKRVVADGNFASGDPLYHRAHRIEPFSFARTPALSKISLQELFFTMRSNHSLCATVILTLSLAPAQFRAVAQTPQPAPGQDQQQPSRIPIWECKLPTGVFSVDVRTVSSISMHEYLVDGGLKITEVTVSPLGSAIARFYYAEPMTASAPGGIGQSVLDQMQQKLKEGADRIAGTSGNEALLYQVIKKYPEATHAHTVEFRLKSKDQAQKIYESAFNAWRQSKPAKLTVE